MKYLQIKSILSALVLGTVLFSCSEESDLATPDENLVTTELDAVVSEASNIAIKWTQVLVDVERYAAGRPNVSARSMAYIYLASYETAVADMEGYVSNESKFRNLQIDQNERADLIDMDLALNTCFSKVAQYFMLNLPQEHLDKIVSLEDRLDDLYSSSIDSELASDSRTWGSYIADRVINYSQSDDDAEAQISDPQPTSYEPPVAEGNWTYSADPERALFPYWESVRTFVISPRRTTSIPPAVYSPDPESEYYAEMMETYTENNAAKEGGDEQLWIGEFWSDDVEGLMMSPPVRQVSIANQLAQQTELDITETLVLMLKLGFSLNDAAVATWKYKYDYMVMRPNVYIHEYIDPDFQTNLYRLVYWPNPSFPSYPSGHSSFASAAAGVFIDTFGNNTSFTDRSHENRTSFRGEPRSFSTLEELAEENAFSRVPLGVHMPMDCEEGLRLGYEISDAINAFDLTTDRRQNF